MSHTSEAIYNFISGAISIECGLAAYVFLRFWNKTHDRFFMFFSISFLVMGSERIVLTLIRNSDEGSPWIYLLRLFAFLLIIVAIVDKNRVRN